MRLLGKSVFAAIGGAAVAHWRMVSPVNCKRDEDETHPDDILLETPVPKSSPVRCVIVGGGYGGARAAYQLDSVFSVTLIDEKNFFEATEDLPRVFCAPWKKGLGESSTEEVIAGGDERLRGIHAMHRYYLKRAQVMTDTAVDVNEKEVILRSGRTVPYDILILATGQQRAFPWTTQQRTASARAGELKNLSRFIEYECHKVAVVGGGPRGVATALALSENYPEKTIDLFHNTSTLIPSLPTTARARALEVVSSAGPNLRLRRNATVVDITPITEGKTEGKHTAINNARTADEADRQKTMPQSVIDCNTEQQLTWWWWPFKSSDKKINEECEYRQECTKFSLCIEETEDTAVETPSVLRQLYFGPHDRTARPPRGNVVETVEETGYDYVLLCNGDTPREGGLQQSAFLSPHLDYQRRWHVSRYMQLLGHPHIFAVGRGNNFPWVRSVGNTDFQIRTLFRNMLNIVNSSKTKNLVGASGQAIGAQRMTFPRLLLPMGEGAAVGSTAWSGAVEGMSALKELEADRQYFYKDFRSPTFYKVQEATNAREQFDAWRSRAHTDVSDFVD